MRNILYKSALIYFILLPIVVLSVFLVLPKVMFVQNQVLQMVVFVLYKSVGFFMYAFPLALIFILVGKSPSTAAEATGQPAPKSTASKWFRIAAGISAAVAAAPFLFTYLFCVGSSVGSGCGDMILLASPIYMIAVPAFLISVIGLLVVEGRRK